MFGDAVALTGLDMPALPVRGLIVVSRITKTKRVGLNQSRDTEQNGDTTNVHAFFQ
jgi:hypothetical protein